MTYNIFDKTTKVVMTICVMLLPAVFNSCSKINTPQQNEVQPDPDIPPVGENVVVPDNGAIFYLDNDGNELWGDDIFTMNVHYLNNSLSVEEPIDIEISLIDEHGAKIDPDLYFSDFPVKITFKGTQASSDKIRVKQANVPPMNITFQLKVNSTLITIINPRFRTLLSQNKTMNNPVTDIMDERMVYERPDKEFRSVVYTEHTGLEHNINIGDPHPNEHLASEGWKFYTAHEFHRYDALPNNLFPEYPQPRGFELYKNYWMQFHSTFTKESTCRVTDSGHLQMWAQRHENCKVADKDAQYYPTRPDYSSQFPDQPDMYNNWEVCALISDAPDMKHHWVDFRPGMRVEVRMRLERQNEAYNPANDIWFMSNRFYVYDGQHGGYWPFLDWPYCGEIDLLETRNPIHNVICSTIHSLGTKDRKGPLHAKTPGHYLNNGVDYSKYNIYWMEWTTDGIVFGINSNVYGRVHTGKSFTVDRDPVWSDEDVWAPFTDDPITGTFYNWDKSYFTNPHGFRMIMNLEIQKKDGAGNPSWSTGWNTEGPNDMDVWLPSWKDVSDPDFLPKMDVDWIRCYYDKNRGFKGHLLCPGGAYPSNDIAINERPEIVNF